MIQLQRVPEKDGTVDFKSRFPGRCSIQQLFVSFYWIVHPFPVIITPKSSNLVATFDFMRNFLGTVISSFARFPVF